MKQQLHWQTFTKGNFSIEVARAGNDVYGNPLYRFRLPEGTEGWAKTFFYLSRKKFLYRFYESKGYGIKQSYNIDWDADAFLDEMIAHEERAKRVGAI